MLTLAEEAVTHAGENGNATFLLAQAGTISFLNTSFNRGSSARGVTTKQRGRTWRRLWNRATKRSSERIWTAL